MTEVVVRCSDGAAHGEIPAASAGMTEVGAGRTEVGTGMTKKRGDGGRAGGGWGVDRGFCAADGVGFGPQIKSGATDLGDGV